MGNEEKKDEVKKIPRNPNIQITDSEVDQILKEAAAKIAGKEEKKPEPVAKREEKKPEPVVKREEKKPEPVVKREEKKPEPEVKREEKKPELEVKREEKKPEPVVKREEKKPEPVVKKEEKKPEPVAKKEEKKPEPVIKREEKRPEPAAKTEEKQEEFKIEDDVIITKPIYEKPDKVTFGSVIGAIFEGIWTAVKLVVLVTIITGVVGFFLSRDLMIRGRNGSRQSTIGMNISKTAVLNKSSEEDKAEKWLEGVKREKLTLTADDGKILVARKIEANPGNDKWVVLLHGYNGSMEDVYDLARNYSVNGYNILMPDLRAHGESEGAMFGMGWLDRLDVINWIDVILKENPSAKVVVHGIDIGGATALMLSGEPIKNSIKAVVAEGAYTSAWDVVKKEYKTRHEKWPTFPVLNMINPVMKVWGGYSLKEADAVKQVKNSKIPILLIRGQNDTYVTEDMTKQLDEAIASEHEVLVVPTGTHGDCRYAEPDSYYNTVFGFLDRYVK